MYIYIYYHYGVSSPKMLLIMVLGGPNSIIAVYVDPLG